MSLPQPAHLVSVPQFAAMRQIPYRTLHRDLLALWARDVAEGGGDWLLRTGRRRKLWVNLSRLRQAHPVLFEQRFASRDDFDALKAKVEWLDSRQKELNSRVGAMGARLRATEARCQTLPTAATSRSGL